MGGVRSNMNNIWMRQRRDAGELEVYMNGTNHVMRVTNMPPTYFDDQLQRHSGTVSVYTAQTGDIMASETYNNQLDATLELGWSDLDSESYIGYMDGIEVNLNESLADPTFIPTSAPQVL